MKKLAIFLAAIALTTGVFAQVPDLPDVPKTPIVWFDEQYQPGFNNQNEQGFADRAEAATGIRRDTAPIAPATLLLLGLGGAVVGTKVVRNRRK
ncbi:MAG: hypothetical protein J6V35_04810 [Bacteroidales bacterium]|nr:hypothetical protein [Bacteroidales bacterium]